MKTQAIILDDEQHNVDYLGAQLNAYFPTIEWIGFINPTNALTYFQNHQVDLIYLDIQMPTMDGFQFLNRLKPNLPPTIFVTAFDEYAIKAIRFSALDYLLKPINIEEFKSATSKAISEIQNKETSNRLSYLLEQLKSNQIHKIALPAHDQIYYIPVADIIRCEGENNYTTVFTESRKYLVSRTLKEYEELLNEHNFARIHLSHLINLNYVHSVHKHDGMKVELTDGTLLPLARSRKNEFLSRI